MKSIVFSQTALNQLTSFKTGNQKLVFKVLELIEDIQKNPWSGIGKPEPLKHDLTGYWSRRINDEHRLIYKVTSDEIMIFSCSGHY
ncbi:MAG TPA: Txe/YoeB family addiction module toxin [Catalimonadaceae bacterium]|nr:Txe/YoeB family addiction module toxin [Catalimonadaceae bacterium]HPI10327.1 Txe/YoeB family addiction module toxin [Catalimonadaceae bacterium]